MNKLKNARDLSTVRFGCIIFSSLLEAAVVIVLLIDARRYSEQGEGIHKFRQNCWYEKGVVKSMGGRRFDFMPRIEIEPSKRMTG